MGETSSDSETNKSKQAKFHNYPFWSPRFWHAMRLGDWLKLLVENRFAIHPIRIPMAFLVTMVASFNSLMAFCQRFKYGGRIAATPVSDPPVFIIGHWRSGTTFLHELMVLDDRFTYPTTYQCFAPQHFLLTEWFFANYWGFLLPKQRPMDNVKAGWQRPQEDEFALLAMGIRTPYRRMAFPNRKPPDQQYLNMEGVSAGDLDKWKEGLSTFVKSLTLNESKRVILKSPTHTGRIEVLSQMFPGAKFIHITRHPYSLFPSTRRLWHSLDSVQGLQLPRNEHLDELVYDSFDRMYRGFESQRSLLPDGSLYELRYEDLVQDPVGKLEEVYQKLQLGDFQPVRPTFEQYVESQKGYQTNRYELEAELRSELRRRWSDYFQRYGYSDQDE
jgi:hypothetical protein